LFDVVDIEVFVVVCSSDGMILLVVGDIGDNCCMCDEVILLCLVELFDVCL